MYELISVNRFTKTQRVTYFYRSFAGTQYRLRVLLHGSRPAASDELTCSLEYATVDDGRLSKLTRHELDGPPCSYADAVNDAKMIFAVLVAMLERKRAEA